uniref:NADH-ubiquinone oxidoreductase chain 4L n=1 Tax=Diplonevra peregrina TaxID=1003499 RepID=A0A7U3T0W3_9MUSC|nr:NADH dehydrogenase subunit 4L [Diplonevra peregrina]QPN53561.1 NADH dehydrogenase subunit 4L [Diplonevra peregrina]
MMMYMFDLLVMVMFLSGMYVFISLRKYLLSMLLSLEFIMLSLFMFLYLFLMFNNYEVYLLMMFIIFMVCEGALGLSILVSMIRTYGNNYFQSFNILKC